MGSCVSAKSGSPTPDIITNNAKRHLTEKIQKYSTSPEKKDLARIAEQKKVALNLRAASTNAGFAITPDRETSVAKSDASSEQQLANMSFARISMMCALIDNHKKGEATDLGPVQKEYSELHRDGTTFVWDLGRMTTDLTANWAGNCFDGLDERASDRDDIGLVILKALIANGTDINTIRTYGRTALQTAALAGDLSYCKELIEKGADLHGKNQAGDTTLSLVKKWNNAPKDLSHIITYLESLE